jgi:holo-[acyl-carrier protein] synthase|tara:strand:+ start:689 stop:1069 length:381 start_codon:yes stop_codon:yes gene_type:complete
MIYGIGTDVVEVKRIKGSIEKFGDAVAKKILNNAEYSIYSKTKVKENFLAKRFAAKEAFAKALGTGFRGLVTLKSIEVTNNSLGKPSIKMTAGLQDLVDSLDIKSCYLSISDEKNIAVAFVVLERE